MMSRTWAAAAVALLSVAGAAPTAAHALAPSANEHWQPVGTGMTGGVSGLAVIENGTSTEGALDLVMVRDNKNPGENRIATVQYRPASPPVVRELPWRGMDEPRDLEAIDAVPGQPGDFVALSSDGTAYHLTLDPHAAMVWGSSPVPGRAPGDNYESFALTYQHGRTVAVWSTRGSSDAQPAQVRAAVYDPNSGVFGAASGPVAFSVPDPLPVDGQEVRHASDIKIHDDGTVLLTAASDPNINSGPFASAVYRAGRVTVDSAGRIGVSLKSKGQLVPLVTFNKEVDNRKIEAVACSSNSSVGIVGTDDEEQGGSLLPLDICPQPNP
ncbi:hypothetical protein [Streptomyces sp. NBC_00690]|uniref:hypothetical protein n=1 Tax=Streptomyces sp. NBC_00690 TaxID=2975808 RepID=UPI002E291059|nr:hypothetical protein [Streptomyces sp. NBC_00690]